MHHRFSFTFFVRSRALSPLFSQRSKLFTQHLPNPIWSKILMPLPTTALRQAPSPPSMARSILKQQVTQHMACGKATAPKLAPSVTRPVQSTGADPCQRDSRPLAGDGTNGWELWKSDGTAAGTMLVKDIASGPTNSLPEALTNVNGTLYFIADDGVAGKNSGKVMAPKLGQSWWRILPWRHQFTPAVPNGDERFALLQRL